MRSFVGQLTRDGRQVALLCHSYGSVVCGLAAPHLPVTDIAVMGSPGMDASSARALDSRARVWAGRGTGDWIGVRAPPPAARPGIRAGPDRARLRGQDLRLRHANHSEYFRPGGIALRNLAYIALGEPAGVTR